MLKKIIRQNLLLAVILFLTSSDLFAQRQINFRKGQNSATVAGKIEANGAKSFSVPLKKNQKVRITVWSGNSRVGIATESSELKVWSFVNREPQDYQIMIYNPSRATSYRVIISVR